MAKFGSRTQRLVFQNQFSSKPEPSMSLTKRTVLFEEFPWLEKYVTLEKVVRVYVFRVGEDLLTYQPSSQSSLGCFLGFGLEESLFFCDREGNKLNVVCRKETVELALARLHESTLRSIYFVFSYSEQTKTVIVYKVPENLSMFDWLSKVVNDYRTEASA